MQEYQYEVEVTLKLSGTLWAATPKDAKYAAIQECITAGNVEDWQVEIIPVDEVLKEIGCK